jgi:hypothetical protein
MSLFKGKMQEVHMTKSYDTEVFKEKISDRDVDTVLDQILKLLKKEYHKLPKLQDLRYLEKGIQGCLLDGYNTDSEEEYDVHI